MVNNISIPDIESSLYESDILEVLTLTIVNVAKANIYWYLDDKSTMYLSSLHVNKNHRNVGIGKRLQIIREQIAKTNDAKCVMLWVKKDSWMHEWYKRCSYQDLKNHDDINFTWMSKNI